MIADILNIVFSAPLVENFINMSNFKRIYTLFSVYVHPNLSKSLTIFLGQGEYSHLSPRQIASTSRYVC
jgi:hypothetical protein